MKTCETCGGTGQQIYLRSWFIQDGLRKERCDLCGGTGESGYRHHDHDWVKKQARFRESFPHHPEARP